VKLAATVSSLGGVGGYGAYTMTPDEIFNLDKQLKQATDKPYNINLWVSDTDAPASGISDASFHETQILLRPYFDELGIPLPEKPKPFSSRFDDQVEVILRTRPPVFSFVFGIPSPAILDTCRKLGIVTVGGATTLDEGGSARSGRSRSDCRFRF
jgi:nitronate monooxygenase